MSPQTNSNYFRAEITRQFLYHLSRGPKSGNPDFMGRDRSCCAATHGFMQRYLHRRTLLVKYHTLGTVQVQVAMDTDRL